MKTADPDQTAPETRSGTTLFAIQLHFFKYYNKQLHNQKQNFGQKSIE